MYTRNNSTLSANLHKRASLLFMTLGRGGDNNVLLGLEHFDLVGHWLLGTSLALGIVGQHNFDLHTNDTLSKHNVATCLVDVVTAGVSCPDHVSVRELHALGTLPPELTGNDHLHTLGTRLHHVPDHTIACTTHGEASKEFELERLGLGDGGKTTVQHLLAIQLDGSGDESEALLDNGGELANAATLLSEDFLGASRADDDLVTSRGLADLAARVAILCELTGEQLVELCVEDSVGDELCTKLNTCEWNARGKSTVSRGRWQRQSPCAFC